MIKTNLDNTKFVNNEVVFKKPIDQTKGFDYSTIEEDGLPAPGTRLNPIPKIGLKTEYFVNDGIIIESNGGKVLNYGNGLQPEIMRSNQQQSALFGMVSRKQVSLPDGSTKIVEKGNFYFLVKKSLKIILRLFKKL